MHNGSSFTDNAEIEMNKKYPTEFRKFTQEDYARLNENIILYKQGNAEASDYIISAFHILLKRYADFICCKQSEHESYIKMHSSISKFVKLFIHNKEYKNTDRAGQVALFSSACANIQKIFRSFEYMDIYNELVCVLLNMASKYKVLKPDDKYYKENGTFHLYVNKCFHYDVFNALKGLAGDPLGFIVYSCDEEPDEDESYLYSNGMMINNTKLSVIPIAQDTEEHFEHALEKANRDVSIRESNMLTLKEEKDFDPFEDDSLNFNWTNGITCSDEFMSLTPYERELLVYAYIQNKKDGDISDIYGCHRITILKHRNAAICKLRNEILKNKQKKKGK